MKERKYQKWSEIDWKKLERILWKMQTKLYQASKRGSTVDVRKIQKMIIRSEAAKYKAVRTVTQDNRGKRTAGIDGIKLLSPKERMSLAERLRLDGKAKPTLEVSIPKGDGSSRKLGIPTIEDRAKQALVRLAVEPAWEATFEGNSYGFRPGRGVHDAIGKVKLGLYRQPKYILDADISKCFDSISHETILNKLNSSPHIIKRQVKAWLKAGIMKTREDAEIVSRDAGTPQGGVISPLLANIALDGLEKAVYSCLVQKSGRGKTRKNNGELTYVRYADDFIVAHKDLEVIQRVQKHIERYLGSKGLELSKAKTKIVHSLDCYESNKPGVGFLGFHIRQVPSGRHNSARVRGNVKDWKLLITPERDKVLGHLKSMKQVIKSAKTVSQAELIRILAPKVVGWCNYYCHVQSKATFSYCDYRMWIMLERWAKGRHPGKAKKIVYQYWNGSKWSFSLKGKPEVRLPRYDETKIRIFTKVRKDTSIYDGEDNYWSRRLMRFHRRKTVRRLLKKQSGLCSWCGLPIRAEDLTEIHHVLKPTRTNKLRGLELVHGHCHDSVHGKS